VQLLLVGIDAGVKLSEARGVVEEDTLRVADGHAGLVGAEALLGVHADHLGDLRFKEDPVRIILPFRLRVSAYELLEVAGHELHVGGGRKVGTLRHSGNDGPRLRVAYLDDHELELAPLLPLVRAAVYNVLAALLHYLVKALEPGIGYVPCFDECYFQG